MQKRPIDKIIQDFRELSFTDMLGAIESGDLEEKDIPQLESDLKRLAEHARKYKDALIYIATHDNPEYREMSAVAMGYYAKSILDNNDTQILEGHKEL